MAAAVMPHLSRESTNSSTSQLPISRQNTISSQSDGRSARQSKRYSHALYLSMSATKEKDLEIADDLAKGGEIFRLAPLAFPLTAT